MLPAEREISLLRARRIAPLRLWLFAGAAVAAMVLLALVRGAEARLELAVGVGVIAALVILAPFFAVSASLGTTEVTLRVGPRRRRIPLTSIVRVEMRPASPGSLLTGWNEELFGTGTGPWVRIVWVDRAGRERVTSLCTSAPDPIASAIERARAGAFLAAGLGART